MGGCAGGAVPTAAGANTQHLLDAATLAANVATLFRAHAPTSIAAFTTSLIDINALCALNPDPPRELTVADFVSGLGYQDFPGTPINQALAEYIYEWLRYQAFTQFCVCTPVIPNPALNCLHGRNITIPSGQGAVVPLGTVQIEAAVYDSWPIFADGTQRISFTQHKVTTSGGSGSVNWTVEFQLATGAWVGVWPGNSFPEGTTGLGFFTLNAASAPIPRNAPLRILTNFGAAGVVAELDLCFAPIDQVVPPLPDQPTLPTLPTVPAPICDTTDLCSIVQDLSRSLTRIAGQISDIQAQIGGTDELTTIGQTSISGEGQLTLAVGTRAVNIELTHIGPGVYTSALGRPRGLMRAGSIRWGDGEGYSERTFIDAEDFTRLRPQGSLTISWQLINEVTATLRFLG